MDIAQSKKLNAASINSVMAWLEEDLPQQTKCTYEQTRAHIEKVTSNLGYGVPFDREQKALNAFLVRQGADLLACLAVWGIYHELNS